MPTSDSEDFESADEGQETFTAKSGRKKRLSSSNYSDNSVASGPKAQLPEPSKSPAKAIEQKESTDGWDDFDIEDDKEPVQENKDVELKKPKEVEIQKQPMKLDTKGTEKKPMKLKVKESKKEVRTVKKVESTEKDSGWDDFDDWVQENTVETKPSTPAVPKAPSSQDIKSVADRLAAASVKEEPKAGWGWGGWGVDSLLSTATAGITTITSHVSQGISTVLETGIGAPDPEEMARISKQSEGDANRQEASASDEGVQRTDDASFPFGSLISGVTKFVETTGTKVIAGGLDTLETIGKKTMEVLQDGDPGLAKKRAMLGLDPNDRPVLSQLLREAKSRADEDDRLKEEKREAKEVHYETLFDDFEGLVHLEALEMLSRQVGMRIEERLKAADADKRTDIKETLQQVTELCEMPEEEDHEDDTSEECSADSFQEKLVEATQDMGLKIQLQPLVRHYTDTLSWLETEETLSEKSIYKKAVSSLAQYTALSVEVYHKTSEMLLVKPRRSTADEADAMTQMTVVLTKHISEMATKFTQKLNSIASENKEQINNCITNVFLEAENSSTYIQNAFQLVLPILQIGAV